MDVATIRKGLNLTQAEFAAQLGTSAAYIGHIETGVRRPSLKLAAKIERLAGVHGLVAAVVAEKLGAA
jgi:transcriptional regulator with XRE-family HTH domain